MEKQREIHRIISAAGDNSGSSSNSNSGDYPHVIKIESKYRPQVVSELR